MLKFTPAVFAVGNEYMIMVPVTDPSLFWVEVGGKCYYDEENGIMRSLCTTHRVSVPTEVLDGAGEYTVCERKIVDRKPYFPVTEEPVKTTVSFRPVPKDRLRIYHIADTHNQVKAPVLAAEQFVKEYGAIDLLVLNGDIPNHSGEIAYFDTIYALAERLTRGEIPIVFARGNHDLRGYYAEQIGGHIPNRDGYTYYSFRLGSLWGLVLDCGEDKPDTSTEYGFTVACHPFREKETAYLRSVIENAEKEYNAPGVTKRIIVAHNPFTCRYREPFNIEEELYTEWARLIKENIHPDLMLCGHRHKAILLEVGCEDDAFGQPCDILLGSRHKKGFHTGAGVILEDGKKYTYKFYDGILPDSEGENRGANEG